MVKDVARELAEMLRKRAELIESLARDPIREVTSKDLDDVLSKYDLVILYFTAEWCGPCISFLSTIREVAAKFMDSRIYWGKVDVDKSFAIADRYGVNHIPSMLVIYKGRVIDSIVGTMSKEKFEEKIQGYIRSYLEASQ